MSGILEEDIMSEIDTQKQEASKETEGGPAEQASEEPGSTSPDDATFDLAKVYSIPTAPDRPELKLTGSEIQRAIGQAELVKHSQAREDKATAQVTELEERALTAEARIQAMEQDAQIVAKLEEAGVLGGKPTVDANPAAVDWLTQEPDQPQLDAKAVATLLNDMRTELRNELKAEFGESIPEQIQQQSAAETERRQQEERYKQFMVAEGNAKAAQIRQAYPDLAPESAEEIAKLSDAYNSSWTDAMKAAAAGDFNTAVQKVQERDAIDTRRIGLQVKASADQRDATRQAELSQQLESGDLVALPEALSDDEERKPITKPEEAKKRKGLVAEYVAKKAEARRLAKTAMGQ